MVFHGTGLNVRLIYNDLNTPSADLLCSSQPAFKELPALNMLLEWTYMSLSSPYLVLETHFAVSGINFQALPHML